MSYCLKFDYPKTPVKLIKRGDKIIKVVDKSTGIIYAEISYNKSGEIIYYKDYLGNWYDSKYLRHSSPYNENTIIERHWYFQKVHKVSSRTIAMDLIPTQPMGQPTGNLFYLDYVYGQNTPQTILQENSEINNTALFNDLVTEMSKYYNPVKIIE